MLASEVLFDSDVSSVEISCNYTVTQLLIRTNKKWCIDHKSCGILWSMFSQYNSIHLLKGTCTLMCSHAINWIFSVVSLYYHTNKSTSYYNGTLPRNFFV